MLLNDLSFLVLLWINSWFLKARFYNYQIVVRRNEILLTIYQFCWFVLLVYRKHSIWNIRQSCSLILSILHVNFYEIVRLPHLLYWKQVRIRLRCWNHILFISICNPKTFDLIFVLLLLILYTDFKYLVIQRFNYLNLLFLLFINT